MSDLRPLLDVQELDLASDQLGVKRETLPERAALLACEARAADLEAAHAALLEKRKELARAEQQLGAEVSAVAEKAKEVETTLYSGTVTATKELAAHQEELRLQREKQSQLEDQEMALLEEIDGLEEEAAEKRRAREACDAEAGALREAIAKAEEEIDGELARLAERRTGPLAGLPAEVVADYERLRGREKLRGRAAVELAAGVCGGCRVKLPVLEASRMRVEPGDALIHCTACGRVLVR